MIRVTLGCDECATTQLVDPRAMPPATHVDVFPGLPTHVVATHVLKFLDDPADLARLAAVSRDARDAVATSGRIVEELEEEEAARLGCVSALTRLLRRGLLDKKHFCTVAAGFGNVHVLRWARSVGCSWDEYTCHAAAKGGQLEAMQWLRDNGCPWDEKTSAGAGTCPKVEMIEWVHTSGCPWSNMTCANAARCGNLVVLQWARQHFCPWNEWTCQEAAAGGHLEVLAWARANDAPWDCVTTKNAAVAGHLHVLQWLRANGCPWNGETCAGAAKGGHLEVLRWAIENGCPWSEWDREHCAGMLAGYIEVQKCLRADPAVNPRKKMHALATQTRHEEVFNWLMENFPEDVRKRLLDELF